MSAACGERFVAFDCAGATLVGIVAAPVRAPADLGVVVVVGGPQYRAGSHRQFVDLARALAGNGYPTLRFDVRGMGDSEGARRSFEDVDDDLAAAVRALAEATGVRRVVLWGLCDGASAAWMAAPSLPQVAGIVAANPWARSPRTEADTRLRHYYGGRILSRAFWAKLVRGEVRVAAALGGLLRTARTRFGRRPPAAAAARAGYLARMQQGWSRFRGPVLVLLSGRDYTAREFEAWVAQDDARRALLAGGRTTVAHVPGADHTFSSEDARDAALRRTLDWLAAHRSGAA